MKVSKQIIFLTFIFNLLCINAIASINNIEQTALQDTTGTNMHNEHYYVSARSGLNYRDTLKGEILGKFPLNTELKIIHRSNVFEEITDAGKTIKGEWLGVQKETDTVYVFSGFLSSKLTASDLNIYYASTYYKDENGIHQGCINVSESYKWDFISDDLTLLYKKDIGQDTIYFDKKQRNKFLRKMNISNRDTAYIYNLNRDTIVKISIKNLSVFASISPYSEASTSSFEHDYQFNFNLEKQYTLDGDNFTVIGNENPFQKKHAKAILWEPMDEKDFPIKFNINIVTKDRRSWFDNVIPKETYKFTNNNYDYYLQNLNDDDGQEHSRYLVVINSTTGSIVFNDLYISSESSYLIPLNLKDAKPEWGTQWTGEIFKNKAPILYGFTSASFGCSSINFLSKTEPAIRILCDNRH